MRDFLVWKQHAQVNGWVLLPRNREIPPSITETGSHGGFYASVNNKIPKERQFSVYMFELSLWFYPYVSGIYILTIRNDGSSHILFALKAGRPCPNCRRGKRPDSYRETHHGAQAEVTSILNRS